MEEIYGWVVCLVLNKLSHSVEVHETVRFPQDFDDYRIDYKTARPGHYRMHEVPSNLFGVQGLEFKA